MYLSKAFTIFLAALLANLFTAAQSFVRDENSVINSTNTPQNYSGPAWIDYDNDGDLDLHVPRNILFINNGDGTFTYDETSIEGIPGAIANGLSWADYDNDGRLDFAMAGSNLFLFHGDGSDFSRITDGVFDPNNGYQGWAAAWGDYNNDGFIDLFYTHAAGFHSGGTTPAFLFTNNGDGRFTKNDDYLFAQEPAPYTIPTWTDYDMDGDLDLLIGSGPANGTPDRDYIFVNQLMETGTADLVRLEDAPLGTDLQDGQTYNTIDFDNDGDFDIYLTNYGAADNHFYVNNNGTFELDSTKLSLPGNKLANNWADTDNDGDLDLLVTSETGNLFFENNGDGTFSEVIDNGIKLNGKSRGASFGDYDDDGDLDLYIFGSNTSNGLFRNENDNGNSWIKFNLEGTVSNKAAIGAKVKVKATINGSVVDQLREVLSSNSFGGHNSLQVHFGLGDASTVQQVIVEWPSGQQTEMTNLDVNKTYDITEDIPSNFVRANFRADDVKGYGSLTVKFSDLSLTDPSNPVTMWNWDFNNDGTIDATEQNPEWTYNEVGTYSVKLTVTTAGGSQSITRENYINVNIEPGIPIISSSNPMAPDTLIGKSGSVDFEVVAEDTTGYDLDYVWVKNGIAASTNSTYNYTSSFILPTPRTDTVTVTVSNILNSVSKTWLVNVVDDPTSVEDEDIPTKYELAQNYPNPFNPSTKIKYSIPERSFVTIKVYDVLGNEVKTLESSEKPAGFYNITWNASNLSSGIYFYSIKAGSFNETKKMTLIK